MIVGSEVERVVEVQLSPAVFVLLHEHDRLADDCDDCVLVLLR
jgi:hypothetical protein